MTPPGAAAGSVLDPLPPGGRESKAGRDARDACAVGAAGRCRCHRGCFVSLLSARPFMGLVAAGPFEAFRLRAGQWTPES
eukprot:2210192-Pyramimonas_sp.AAC.1